MTKRPELDFRRDFTAALLQRAPDAHPPALDARSARRFRVYRNNVHGALIGALVDAYPVLQRLVGADFFAAMAREFILAEPAREATLALYGHGFAAFIEGFEPAGPVAYLADIARLERARLEALHAADAMGVAAAALPVDGERLLATRFEAHPATRLVESAHPIVSIWLANPGDEPASSILARRESALVTRARFEVGTQLLDEAGTGFTRSLLQGETVANAYASAASIAADFDVATIFSRLLEAGAFSNATTTGEN